MHRRQQLSSCVAIEEKKMRLYGAILIMIRLSVAKAENEQFRFQKMEEYGLKLNDYQLNALEYVEGEYKGYNSEYRASNPLAAFCHMCDTASARIWFDYPEIDKRVQE